MYTDFGNKAIEEAEKQGASYTDIRINEILKEALTIKNGDPEIVTMTQTKGFGIRVIVGGAWGFAGSVDVNEKEIVDVAKKAVEIARATKISHKKDVALILGEIQEGQHKSSYQKDPFKIPLENKLDVLVQASNVLKEQSPLIKAAYTYYRGYREDKFFMSSEGAEINQQITWCGGGISGIAVKNREMQKRSYPSSFGGNNATKGYEFFKALALVEHAKETGQELIKLLEAEKCPTGEKDLILTGDQLALQIHESCGHPTELDRALGTEADYAGTSFLTPEKLGKFMYGSEKVNIVADATTPNGLGTFGFDDEGVRAKKTYLVKKGLFSGYQSSRESAADLSLGESSGGMRADSPLALPLIRMTNINLVPGEWNVDEVIEDTKDGVLMMTNRSWSIDDKRINFQFGTEIGWRIKNGSRERIIKNPTYMGVTPQFWGQCDAVTQDDWMMWGLTNCGKGVPSQVMYVGHGCGTARFCNVHVGLT